MHITMSQEAYASATSVWPKKDNRNSFETDPLVQHSAGMAILRGCAFVFTYVEIICVPPAHLRSKLPPGWESVEPHELAMHTDTLSSLHSVKVSF
jgi:hypothetical protein